jgi:hypothetical protein
MAVTAAEFAALVDDAKRRRNGWWNACCPAHDDTKASLSFRDGDEGGLVFKCFRGCDKSDILAKIGLTMADLFKAAPSRLARPRRKIVQTYNYEDEKGLLVYQAVRYEPKDFRQRRPDGKDGWIWNMTGVRRVVYRLPELRRRLADPDAEYRRRYGLPDDVFVVEGEKDADHLLLRWLIATTNIGGAGNWHDDYAKQLVEAGAKSVVVLPDNDDPGRRHAQDVARSCHAAGLRVKMLELPGLPERGDVSDFLR